MKSYHLQYGSGRVVPLGTGRFLASLIKIIRVPLFFLLCFGEASEGTYLRATIMSPFELITDSSSGGSVCKEGNYLRMYCFIGSPTSKHILSTTAEILNLEKRIVA